MLSMFFFFFLFKVQVHFVLLFFFETFIKVTSTSLSVLPCFYIRVMSHPSTCICSFLLFLSYVTFNRRNNFLKTYQINYICMNKNLISRVEWLYEKGSIDKEFLHSIEVFNWVYKNKSIYKFKILRFLYSILFFTFESFRIKREKSNTLFSSDTFRT